MVQYRSSVSSNTLVAMSNWLGRLMRRLVMR
eukprot:CAMPEP_0197598940 /NCGR_PEP_ID=MMETSP1326-20131121/30347_1 /TAXON_ID=1155430 /ORGANISM="Genus nov. species nov., Strain RCC2288" /LENGTH=30 /DNA_ID= /DNA_START= /DNA_END= /DNA_ORIENTATION=